MASNIMEEAGIPARIVAHAGGEVVGRTRLQKIAFLLEVFEQGDGLDFEYKHYGPYSDRLSSAVKTAEIFDLIKEELRSASWGGFYSIFRSELQSDEEINPTRKAIIDLGNAANPVELELAATAVFLAREDRYEDPWLETSERKPEKSAGGRIDRAKALLDKLKEFDSEHKLPSFS